MTHLIQGYARAFHVDASGLSLMIDTEKVLLTPDTTRQLTMICTAHFACVACQRPMKKNYQQGYCYPCSRQLACCDLCILKPSLCHYHLGTCREPSWGEEHCMINHIVYASWTSGIKVGITRHKRMHTRWREQGAAIATPLYTTSRRKDAGDIEAHLSKHYNDRTDWRKMLISTDVNADIFHDFYKEIALFMHDHLSLTAQPYEPTVLSYAILGNVYPRSLGHSTQDFTIQSPLIGIKGHYLIFTTGVLSVRSLLGRALQLTIDT